MKLASSIIALIFPFAACVSSTCVKMPVMGYEIEAQKPIIPAINHGGPPAECGDPRTTLPFLRAWNAKLKDHLYTTNQTEMNNSITSLGYTDQGTTGYIFPTQELSTVPLYRLYQLCQYDHFYTVDKDEADAAVNKYGYTAEGIAGYVYPPWQNSSCGGVPLYRLYSVVTVDHLYTTSEKERDSASKNNYTLEGVAAYIFPF